MFNKKILTVSLAIALGLTACNKPAEQTQTEANPQQVVDQAVQADHSHDNKHDHDDHDDKHDHDHDHDHDHAGHDHHHDQGDAYQCNNQTVYIAVHNHEGEMEAHLSIDDITYDLDQDPQNHMRYTTDDGIGNHQTMSLTLDGNKATVTGDNNALLLDCTK